MIDALAIACVLVLFRVSAFVAFMPPLAGQGLPSTVKVGLSVALSVLLAPQYAPAAAAILNTAPSGEAQWLQLGLFSVRETALGAGLAWLFGLCLIPVRTAGAWISQEMGLTLAGLASPLDQQPGNPVSQVLEALGLLMFFALDLHHVVLCSLMSSFVSRPIAERWIMPSWESVVHGISHAVEYGLVVIAPVGILLFVTLLVLLITMRTAPQFNFMSYGMTLRLVAGMVGVVLFFPELCSAFVFLLQRTDSGVNH